MSARRLRCRTGALLTVVATAASFLAVAAGGAGAASTTTTAAKGAVRFAAVAAPLQPPIAGLTASVVSGLSPVVVTFTPTGADPSGSLYNDTYTFNDGQGGVTAGPWHNGPHLPVVTYTPSGAFTASLTISDAVFCCRARTHAFPWASALIAK